jgi:hypothetical protein
MENLDNPKVYTVPKLMILSVLFLLISLAHSSVIYIDYISDEEAFQSSSLIDTFEKYQPVAKPQNPSINCFPDSEKLIHVSKLMRSANTKWTLWKNFGSACGYDFD